MVLQSYIIHRREKIHKKSNNFFESKCLDVTKRARFAAFAISIVDNLCCLLQPEYKWSTIKIQLPRLIINSPYASNVMTILDFFIGRLKKTGRCQEVILGSWGHTLVVVAVEERFIKTRVNVWTAHGTKKQVVVGRWPLAEIRLYFAYYTCCFLSFLVAQRRRRRTRNLTKPRPRRPGGGGGFRHIWAI